MTNRRKSEQPALVASLSKGGRKGYAPREEIGKIYGSLRDSQHHLNNAPECLLILSRVWPVLLTARRRMTGSTKICHQRQAG